MNTIMKHIRYNLNLIFFFSKFPTAKIKTEKINPVQQIKEKVQNSGMAAGMTSKKLKPSLIPTKR